MDRIQRIFRLHQNGRTILPWWVSMEPMVDLPLFHDPRAHLRLDFISGLIMRDGVVMYQFTENEILPPLNEFHRIDFLYDNNTWTIEYRRLHSAEDR